MDETSTAAAVGDGTAHALGAHEEEEDSHVATRDEIKTAAKESAAEKFIQACGEGPHSPRQVRNYMLEMAPGVSEKWIGGLVKTLREKGYVV